MIKAIIFDLDGTLVDSIQEITILLNKLRESLNLVPLPESSYKALVSHGAKRLLEFATEKDNICESEIDNFRASYRGFKSSETLLFDSVPETLKALHEQGIKLAICTNKPDFLCDKVLKDTKIIKYFDTIVSNCGKRKVKPAPDMIEHALSLLGTNRENTFFVGDSTVDQRACLNASIPFVFYVSGYDDGVDSKCSYINIDNISELLEIVSIANIDVFVKEVI